MISKKYFLVSFLKANKLNSIIKKNQNRIHYYTCYFFLYPVKLHVMKRQGFENL
ncbi:MAG: hypothetical protein ACTSRA_12365 [Promethearchaeota archaeon]